MKILFIAWDGAGANYLESLFLPIFARLQNSERRFSVLEFTWMSKDKIASIRRAALKENISYSDCAVWRRPVALASAAMIVRGAYEIVKCAKRNDVEVLMPRSLLPAAMVLIARRWLPNIKLFFDADGLMADERADFGGWSRGGIRYRALRAVERSMLRRADLTMTRTARAKQILLQRAGRKLSAEKIYVIPNGKDEVEFNPGMPASRRQLRREIGITEDAPVLVYAGSIGPQYYPREILGLFAEVHKIRPDARLLILTSNSTPLDTLMHSSALTPESVIVKSVAARDVARYLAASDLGIAFRMPSLSQQAVSPIKIGEYLLCGVPVVATAGVGDLDAQLDSSVSMLIEGVDLVRLCRVRDWLLNDVLRFRDRYRETCRQRGVDSFGLKVCVARYHDALESLTPMHKGERRS